MPMPKLFSLDRGCIQGCSDKTKGVQKDHRSAWNGGQLDAEPEDDAVLDFYCKD